MRGETKLEELRRQIEARRSEGPSEKMPEDSPRDEPQPMCCRQNAVEMIRRRCVQLREEEQRLLTLLRVIELGSEKYGEGAQDAELALWHLLTDGKPRMGW